MKRKRTFEDFVEVLFDPDQPVWSSADVKDVKSIKTATTLKAGDNYFAPNPVKTKRSNPTVVAFQTLFTEADHVTVEQQTELITAHKKILSAAVFSGNKSYHVFVRLEEPFESREEWLKYQRKLHVLFEGDPSRSGSSSVMRLPFADRNGAEQKLGFLGKRRSRASVTGYLDSRVPDTAIKVDSASDSDPIDFDLAKTDKQKLDGLLKSDQEVKRLIEDGKQKKQRDEKGWRLAHYCREKHNLSKEETAYILLATSKGTENPGWVSRTVNNAYADISKKPQSDGYAEVIKRHLQYKREDTLREIRDKLARRYSWVKENTVYRVVKRLIEKNELFKRQRNGVELISLIPPALVDSDPDLDYDRYLDKTDARIAAYPHPEWNLTSGGGLVRGCLTGMVCPTSRGKTHFVSALAATALKEDCKVCIFSTEREPGYYVDYITATFTGTEAPKDKQEKKEWTEPTRQFMRDKRLLIPKQAHALPIEEVLTYVQNHQGVDLIIFDYLHPNTVQLDQLETSNSAQIVTAIRKIESRLTSDKVYKELGVSRMPAVFCVLQRKEGWNKHTALFYPKAEITGEKQGAYAQSFETIFTLVEDEADGPASNMRYTNRYVISKSKPSCGELLERVEFTTVVHQKTNTTETFKLGWDAVSDDLIDL